MTVFADAPPRSDPGKLRKILHWFRKHKIAAVAVLVIVALYSVGFLAEWIAPHDPNFQEFSAPPNEAPSWNHWFGTDNLSRDSFSRILFSLRTTIGITGATLFTGTGVFAILFGVLAAYKGGWIETVFTQAGSATALFPELMFMILIAATVGPRYHAFMDDIVAWQGTELVLRFAPLVVAAIAASIGTAVFAARKDNGGLMVGAWLVGVVLFFALALSWFVRIEGFADFFLIFLVLLPFSWFGAARLIRSQVLSLREQDFVLAAKALGASDTRIVLQHLLPNVMGLVVFLFSIGFGAIASAEIGLTYLGL